MITYLKGGLWVNYRLADGAKNQNVASLPGNLRHWLEDDTEVEALLYRLPEIQRKFVCK